jgi:hypothetical protein
MFDDFMRTVVKLGVASLVLGAVLAHFGVTPEKLLGAIGLTPEQAMDLGRRAIAWALPDIMVGGRLLVPIWLVVYLLRPPRPRARLE